MGEGGIEVTTTGWDATEVPAAPDDAMTLTGEPAPPAPEPEDGEAPDVPDGEVPSVEKIWPTVVERARSASSVTSSSVEAGTYEPRTQIITGQTDDSNVEQRSLVNGKASTERLVDGVTYLKGDVAYWDSAIELADRWLIKPDEGSPLLFTPSQEIEDLLAWVGPAEGTEMVRAELTTFRGAPAYCYTLVTADDDPRQVWVSAEKEPRLLMVAIDQGGDEWGVYTLTDWDRVEPVIAPEGAVPLGQ
ncbi:hypothetical protein [Ornithinimicrobium tianjinense]|uniref:Uncharacterized protein n=1 Tax=Ornithinimicrobium tianjinense TaxID=1195761 RepID=A0A917F3E8_9MICO|nr:hypothetical protein [Ornithinimicrobium tianjinense]GGF39289.1 hypothetical protein GCM10011366_03630 [Ornithinimicrobium tianjinense]